MPRLHLAWAADLPVNAVRQIVLDTGTPIALYHLADGFFATDDRCSHGEASLAEGEIEDGEIVCPFHLGKFDIRSGEATAAPCLAAIKTYPVVLDADGNLYIEIP